MGFDAKQIIHPAQIAIVQKAFSPSDKGEPIAFSSASATGELHAEQLA